MNNQSSTKIVLKQVDILERELVRLKRDILHNLIAQPRETGSKLSLFGSVKGGDVTDEMIEDSKRNLFRKLEDI